MYKEFWYFLGDFFTKSFEILPIIGNKLNYLYMLITGVDIIEIKRVEKVALSYGDRFLKRIYTDGEIKYCRGRAPQLASRFAAKEAVMKALGTGIRGVGWRDVEVTRKRGMAPDIKLHGRAQ